MGFSLGLIVSTRIPALRTHWWTRLAAAGRPAKPDWMAQERDLIERERSLLGFDPYRYELGEVQRHTIEKLMDYLQADGLLRRRFTVEELFPLAGRR